MVQVRAVHPTYADGNVDIQAWMAGLKNVVELSDAGVLQQACELAQKCATMLVKVKIFGPRKRLIVFALALKWLKY